MRSRLVDSEWIADHGYRIIRLLPGGVDIVGNIFFCADELG